jgi:hypothetical protein
MDTDEHGFNLDVLKALRKLAQGWRSEPDGRGATTLGLRPTNYMRPEEARGVWLETKLVQGRIRDMSQSGNRSGAKQAFVPLSQSHPLLAAQWHPTKNGNVSPGEFWANRRPTERRIDAANFPAQASRHAEPDSQANPLQPPG